MKYSKYYWLYHQVIFLWILVFTFNGIDATAKPSSISNLEKVQTVTTLGRGYLGEKYPGQGKENSIFEVLKVEERGKGIDRLRQVRRTLEGRIAQEETLTFENDIPTEYVLRNHEKGQYGKITVTKKELIYEVTENGKTRKSSETRPDLFAIGPSLYRLIHKSISQLKSGKVVSFQMVVLNRMETFSFDLEKVEPAEKENSEEYRKGRWLKLSLKPSSVLFQAFVPKMFAVIDTQSGKTISFIGPLSDSPSALSKVGTILYD